MILDGVTAKTKSNPSPVQKRVVFVVAVESLSHVLLSGTPWTVAQQAPLSFAISQRWLKFISIELLVLI